jgi:hypothetical protein
MTSERKPVVVHLVTEPRGYLECETKTGRKRSDVELRIVSNGFIRPKIVFITLPVRPQRPLSELVLHIVEIDQSLQKPARKIEELDMARMRMAKNLPIFVRIHPVPA